MKTLNKKIINERKELLKRPVKFSEENKNDFSKEKILKLVEEKIKEKFGITINELLNEKLIENEKISEDNEFEIPIGIFKTELGAAEALVKYLHDNESLKFSEIAKLINRDQRTVWVNYNNSLKSGKIRIKESGMQIPVAVFSDRRLSIFESLVKYLRENGYKNLQIAEILDKDQRNIGTFYSRALRKMVD